MNIIQRIEVFGDSILKGIQINPENDRYCVDNRIDLAEISARHDLTIENFSKFGCTITKGKQLLFKWLEKGIDCDAIVMDYGGNDCDYDWKAISERPQDEHEPNTPIAIFKSTYFEIIEKLREKGILPILTTLPPLDAGRFFNWFMRDLNKENVLKWLGSINVIFRHQETYSEAVSDIAKAAKVPLVDLRGAFLSSDHVEDLLCDDGTHPNSAGQKIITDAFLAFAARMKQSRILFQEYRVEWC